MTTTALGLTLILLAAGGVDGRSSTWDRATGTNLGRGARDSASLIDRSGSALESGSGAQAAEARPAPRYYIYGRYEVTMSGRSGPLIKAVMLAGTFTLSDDPDGNGPSGPTGLPDGSGRYAAKIGKFEPGQTGCRPQGGYDYPQGTFDIVADVEGSRLGVWIVPHPPASDPLLDIFDTRFSALEFGAKHLDVPVTGGAFTWGGGTLPMRVECNGLLPGSWGGFGVARMRDRGR